MKVILLKDLPGLGKKYEVAEVAGGFARNFLLPRGEALMADKNNLTRIEKIRKKLAVDEEKNRLARQKDLAEISGQTVTIEVAANTNGVLFAALHPQDIIAAINSQHQVSLPVELAGLPNAIKKIGEYDLVLNGAKVKLVIKPREQP